MPCSDSAIPIQQHGKSGRLAVTQEFWAQILADPKDFSLWNCFNGDRSNLVMPESAS